MATSKLTVVCDYFRTVENELGVATVIGDVEATRVLAAFANFAGIRWSTPRRRQPSADSKRWQWLWDGAEVDFEDLASRAGVDEATAEQKLVMLVGARLVYPDGSISKHAELMLRAYVAQHLPKPKR